MRDLFALADVVPETGTPPEAALQELMVANTAAGGSEGWPDSRETSTLDSYPCVRRWKLGGCAHCPTWGEVGELWKSAAERRRSGGFTQLAPSIDEEWASHVPPPDLAAGERASPQQLLVEWLRRPANISACAGSRHASRGCYVERWHSMLCAPGP
jgi:hypothetical protein